MFIGDDAYDLVLGDDPARWPWSAWLLLPGLSYTLLSSAVVRTFGSGESTAVLSLLLTPSILGQSRLIAAGPEAVHALVQRPVPVWPPSPFTLVLVYPLIRRAYTAVWKRVATRALGIPSVSDVETFMADAVADARERVRQQADGGDGGEDVAIAQVRVRIENEAENVENVAAAIRTVAISAGFGRRVAAGLLLPAVAALAGAALWRISRGRGGGWLRALLGPSEAVVRGTGGLGVFGLGLGTGLAQMGHSTASGFASDQASTWGERWWAGWTSRLERLVWGETRLWTDGDPVWWRNTLGLSLYFVVRFSFALASTPC
jgi:hypothetical protein